MRLVFSMVRPDGSASRDYTVEGETLQIGRDEECDIVLDASTVSSRHAQVTFQNGKAILEDLKSTNGTFLNGRRISDVVVLTNGCTLQFGATGPRLNVTSVEWSVPSTPHVASNPTRNPRFVLAVAAVAVCLSIIVAVAFSRKEEKQIEPIPTPATVGQEQNSGEPGNAGKAPTLVEPLQLRFVLVGIQSLHNVFFICGGMQVDEKHVLTCGSVARIAPEQHLQVGETAGRLIVGIPNAQSQWTVFEVEDRMTSTPETSQELTLMTLKSSAPTTLTDRYSADEATLNNAFNSFVNGKTELGCWGWQVAESEESAPDATRVGTTLQFPGTAPVFKRVPVFSDPSRNLNGVSKFRISGKEALPLFATKNRTNDLRGLVAFSSDGTLLGMLQENGVLVPADRIVYGLSEKAKALLK